MDGDLWPFIKSYLLMASGGEVKKGGVIID
jgi:hypothetical protein